MAYREYNDEDFQFPWAPFEEIEEVIPRKANISPILKEFLNVYSRINDPLEMYLIPVSPGSYETWGQKRDAVVSTQLARYLNKKSDEGKLSLELWGYDVDKWGRGNH